jgi:hypothetical protein
MVLECDKVLELSVKTKLQQFVNILIMEGDDDPVLVMRAISSHLQLLKDNEDCYREAKVVGQREKSLKITLSATEAFKCGNTQPGSSCGQ